MWTSILETIVLMIVLAIIGFLAFVTHFEPSVIL